MKKILENAVKFLIFAGTAAAFYFLFNTQAEWWLAILFFFTIIVTASYVFMGGGASVFFLAVSMAAYALVFMKALAAQAPLVPFAAGAALLIACFILVRKVNDANEHFIDNARDELKVLEGDHGAMLTDRKNVQAGLDANREKLEKYRKLKEIRDGIGGNVMFSDKLRHILRNVVDIFHREKAITLFLTKENMAFKVYADKNEDEFSGDPDHEGMFLKNFDEWVIANRRSLIVADMRKEVRFRAEDGEKVRSLIGVPVFSGDKAVGLLRVTSEAHGVFSHEDLRFLDLVAGMVCRVMEGERHE